MLSFSFHLGVGFDLPSLAFHFSLVGPLFLGLGSISLPGFGLAFLGKANTTPGRKEEGPTQTPHRERRTGRPTATQNGEGKRKRRTAARPEKEEGKKNSSHKKGLKKTEGRGNTTTPPPRRRRGGNTTRKGRGKRQHDPQGKREKAARLRKGKPTPYRVSGLFWAPEISTPFFPAFQASGFHFSQIVV